MNDNDLNLSLALQDFALEAEEADHKQLNTMLLLAMTRLRQLSDRLEIAEKWIKWAEGASGDISGEARQVLDEIK